MLTSENFNLCRRFKQSYLPIILVYILLFLNASHVSVGGVLNQAKGDHLSSQVLIELKKKNLFIVLNVGQSARVHKSHISLML